MARQSVEFRVQATQASSARRFTHAVWRLVAMPGGKLSGDPRLLIKLVVTVVVVLVALLWWDVGSAFFLGLLVACVTGLIDGRVSVVIGLICIASCPVLQIAEQHAWLQQSTLVNYYAANLGLYSLNDAADYMAIWAYYFLCIGVIAQIVQYVWRGKRQSSE